MKINKIISGAAAMCLLLCTFTACGDGDDDGGSGGHGSPEAAAESLLSAVTSGNATQLTDAVMPPVLSAAIRDKNSSVYDGFMDEAQELIDELKKYYGDDYTVTANITSKKELKDSELEDWDSNVKSICKSCGIEEHAVSEGYKIKFDYTVKGSKDSRSDSGQLEALNIDGIGWYALDYDY